MSFLGSFKTRVLRKQVNPEMSSLNLTELTVGQKSFLRARGYDPMAINGRATQQGFFFLRFFFIHLLVRPIPSEYKEEN